MFRECCQLIRQWLVADRIRCAPGYGRLLGMTVRSRVLVRDRLWCVMKCSRKQESDKVIVEYELLECDAECDARLVAIIDLANVSKCQLRWYHDDLESELFDEDVVPLRSQAAL